MDRKEGMLHDDPHVPTVDFSTHITMDRGLEDQMVTFPVPPHSLLPHIIFLSPICFGTI